MDGASHSALHGSSEASSCRPLPGFSEGTSHSASQGSTDGASEAASERASQGSSAAPATTPFAHLSRDQLEAQITDLAGHLNAATYRWLTLIAEFDRRQGWVDGSLHSCAHWLNFKVGLNLGAAREKVRVAHALAGVPKIAAAMARGELSYFKVRALTRVATAATEDTLLMIALHGTAYHVETVVSYFRQASQAEELSRDAQQQAGRTVDYWYDNDGSLVLKARLPALAGAIVVKALEHALDATALTEVPADRGAEHGEQRVPAAARRADALALMAEAYLQHATAQSSTADRHQVVVHVDAETLKDQAPGRCHLEHGPTLPIETVRRLTCDASLVRITENANGEPLDVGRKTRTIPPAIRRALHTRDPGCCFPGCTYRRYLDAHHIEHWADGGATKLSNLVTLCRAHHRLVHEGGIRVEALAGGGWRFRRPDGREYAAAYRQPAQSHHWTALRETHAADGLAIDATTAATRWRGERMDYELGVWVLCNQVAWAKRADAEAAHAKGADASVAGASAASAGTAGAGTAGATAAGVPGERADDAECAGAKDIRGEVSETDRTRSADVSAETPLQEVALH